MSAPVQLNPASKSHKAIVLAAIATADEFGMGRISAARAQLELNNILVKDLNEFHGRIYAWGKKLDNARSNI